MRKTLFMASEVRSGSTFVAESFCYALERRFGYGLWQFTEEKFSSLSNASTSEDVLGIATSLNQVGGHWSASKVMCHSLSILTRESRKVDAVKERLFGENAFWIIVRRRDKIGQAVSLAMADKSRLYHYYGDGGNSPDLNVKVDNGEIMDALRAILASDTYLEVFSRFMPEERCVTLFYEDFVRDTLAGVNKINALCGFPLVSSEEGIEKLAKLRRTASESKRNRRAAFQDWFLENYHFVPG